MSFALCAPPCEWWSFADGACTLQAERGATTHACAAGSSCAWGARVCPGDEQEGRVVGGVEDAGGGEEGSWD